MSTEQRIFISYRRSDCQSQANALNEGLRHRLTDALVFMDIDSIPPGADFETHIREEINQCDVVLVLIGDEWLAPTSDGTRRIDDPTDWVRAEVETALRADGVRVIPVLVEGATMPQASDLPDDIARLARRNAFELSDKHWPRDIAELTNQLRAARPDLAPDPEPTVTFSDIDMDAVKYAVSALPPQFATKDVSTHPAMLATHDGVAGRSNYHTMVGRFLMQRRNELGLGSPEAPQDERGSRWTKVGASGRHGGTPPEQQPRPAPSPPPYQATSAAPLASPASSFSAPAPSPRNSPQFVPPAPTGSGNRSAPAPEMKNWMVWLPLYSFGLLAFVPPIWAASQLKHDPDRRRKLDLVGGVLALGALLAFILIGSSPEDAEGSPTGAGSSIGTALAVVCAAAGIFFSLRNRRPAPALAGIETEMARRELRQQYRQSSAGIPL